jgi:hypothetical protein
MWWIHISLVEVAYKPFYIHCLTEILQYTVHYVFANLKMMSNTHMKTENFLQKFACGYWRTVIICLNVVDIILKNFNQVVDTLMIASSLQY